MNLLYDTRQHVSFVTTMKRLDSSLIGSFRKADKTVLVRSDQLQTAVHDDGFEIDLICRTGIDGDPHPLPRGDIALMRTVHPRLREGQNRHCRVAAAPPA